MPPHRPTPALMLQGCSSNAGKSVLAAAFCRMLLQDGFRVAPFKAQNMSLNSCVTADGAEMGRAQVTQAQACRLAPDARMNPVLLKPCSPTGSQVLLLGKPVGHMRVREYMAFKPEAFAAARQAYDELAAGHEVMVLEGAGSPAEVNLKAHDIVNMAMARHAQARVLLAGDIDRGGVFAHFVGTLALLEPGERDLVEGLLVNRFRGDASLLTPAFEAMRRHAGKDVLGVIPWLADLGLPEEDSVTFKEAGAAGRDAGEGRPLRLALVDLPHISNFTDFDALRLEPDVQLRVARTPADLAGADAILIPGTRSTAADLETLRARGMAAAILDLAARPAGDGPELVGICGGLQMLGEDILDDDGVESAGPTTRGLGLLPLRTSMGRDKILRQTAARHVPSGLEVRGYEIHHGRTEARGEGATPWLIRDEEVLGWGLGSGMAAGRIWGAYLHGLFDDDAFRRQWLNGLRRHKGLPPLDIMTRHDLEPALDRLADAVRAAVDWPRIRRSLGL